MAGLVVLTTVASRKQAQKLARRVLQKKIAACVTYLPGAVSTYRWKNKIETSREYVLYIKTTRRSWAALKDLIKDHHPYELPECIAWPITSGTKEYLTWLESSVRSR